MTFNLIIIYLQNVHVKMKVSVLKLEMAKWGVCASQVITDVCVKKEIAHHGPEWITRSLDGCETMNSFVLIVY